MPRSLLWVVAVCCVLVAVFPTNLTGPLTVSAEIHRYAAAVAFTCVPVVALLVARRLDRGGKQGLVGTIAGTAGLLVLFPISHVGLVPGVVQEMSGVFQRMMFALQLVALAQLLHVGRRAAGLGNVRTPDLVRRPRLPAQVGVPGRGVMAYSVARP